jgi:ATP-dependent Clp protease ATP-binding subunit ClpA
VRDAVLAIVPPGDGPMPDQLGYTPRMKRALRLAEQQAEQLGHRFVGTEHLLLGLLAEGEGVGADVLSGFGITLERVQDRLRRFMSEGRRGPQGVKGLVSQVVERERGVRRYSLVLPEELFQRVQTLADAEQTTVVDLLRRFTRLGLLIMDVQRDPDASIVIRQGGTEQRLVVL